MFGGDGSKTTPESFGNWLADVLLAKLNPAIKQMLREAPTKLYDIIRQTPTGPVQQQVSLSQMMAELTDALKVQSYFSSEELKLKVEQLRVQTELLKETKLLTAELKKSRKLAREMALDQEEEE